MKRLAFLLTALAALVAAAAVVAAPAPKATGGYGYNIGDGVQRHLTFNAIQSTTNTCGVFWNVTGITTMSFTLAPDLSTVVSTHEMILTQNGESVSGSGGYPTSGPPYQYFWHLASGSVLGNTLSMTAVYDGAPDATGTIWHMTGTIAPNGSISGVWDDNYLGGFRSGTFVANSGAAGVATPYATYCGKGNAYYTDSQGSWYFMNVKAVSVSGNTAWYAAEIIASNLGFENLSTNYLFVKVIDNGEPGIGHDVTSGDLMTPSGALAAVAAHLTPTISAVINEGNIQVH